MAEIPKSFEEFYYDKTQNICSVNLVTEYAEKHNGDYSPYREHMLCPECQEANLFFVNKTSKRRAHLKRLPSSAHKDDCSYNYEYASKNLVEKFVNDLTYNEIQDKLDAMITFLNKHKTDNNLIYGKEREFLKSKDNPMLIPDKRKKIIDLKSIRRKRLTGWIGKEVGTDLHLFYGTVKLEVTEKEKINDNNEKYKYYVLTIKTLNSKDKWVFRTSTYRGTMKDNINPEKIYQIAMIGNLNFDYKWPQIKLLNKDAIRIKEIN